MDLRTRLVYPLTMRLVGILALAVLGSGAPGLAADCQVERHGDLVSVRARAVPLSEVLDLLALRTGMKVTYEGNRPSARVSLDLNHLTVEQMVFRVLEGQGVDYVAQSDPAGRTVETLLVSGTLKTSAQAAPSRQRLPSTTEWRAAAASPMGPMVTSALDASPAQQEQDPEPSAADAGPASTDPMAPAIDPMTGAAAAMPEATAPWSSPFESAPVEPTAESAVPPGSGAGPRRSEAGRPMPRNPHAGPPGPHAGPRRPHSEKSPGEAPPPVPQ